MRVVICYDVHTVTKDGKARLRRVADICENHGTRVQYSVFECPVDDPTWLRLRTALLSAFDAAEDSLRFYFLDERSRLTEHHGVRSPLDLEGPLVL